MLNLKQSFYWLINNLLWGGLIKIFSIAIATCSAFKISRFLLKQNRFTRGNGKGRHLADRCIDCWRDKNGLISTEDSFYTISSAQSSWFLSIIDKELERNKLVYIKDKKVYPIINSRNWLIVKILKFYLVCMVGDKKTEYKDL